MLLLLLPLTGSIFGQCLLSLPLFFPLFPFSSLLLTAHAAALASPLSPLSSQKRQQKRQTSCTCHTCRIFLIKPKGRETGLRHMLSLPSALPPLPFPRSCHTQFGPHAARSTLINCNVQRCCHTKLQALSTAAAGHKLKTCVCVCVLQLEQGQREGEGQQHLLPACAHFVARPRTSVFSFAAAA